MSPSAVSITNAEFAWPGQPPLLVIPSLNIAPAETLFLSGPSGSGKSTFLALIAGIHLPTRGSVTILGEDTRNLSAGGRDRLRGEKMGFVFQQFNLISYLSTLDNVMLPRAFSRARRRRSGSSDEATDQARSLLARLDLPDDVRDRSPATLSVGQQQRVAVARALFGSPELIICDEPTSALDADARSRFLDLLAGECERSQAALCFVSHDVSLASHFHRQVDVRSFNPSRAPSPTPSPTRPPAPSARTA